MENSKQLRILMLEDSADDAFLVERVLSRSDLKFVTERVDSREEFTRSIHNFSPNVILSDHGLPSFNSREALKICQHELIGIPFILVTGTMSDENAIACLRDGADDYILKSNLSRLPAAIHRSLKARRLEKLKREARYALRKQNSELMKVNQELDNFVYAVSHNLRGPVASIMGLLNIAATRDGRNQIDSLLSMIRDRTLRLDETVREILEFSNNARSELSFSEIDWNRVATSSWERLTYIPQAKDILHLIHIGRTSEAFASDPTRVNLILNCVYSNTIVYSDPGRESIVGTEVAFRDGSAVITVKDNGVGIAESCLPNVFNMFYRANENSQGAGLGLYIARETVRKLNGSIDISSEEGRGTTVTIVLPNEKSRLK